MSHMKGGACNHFVSDKGGGASKVVSCNRRGGGDGNWRIAGVEEEVNRKVTEAAKVIDREGNEGSVVVV
jgi:hypothetical protein